MLGDRMDVTALLKAWNGGDATALERLTPLVYDELRRVAHRYMLGERGDHTLQTTALINEAYVRLIDLNGIDWQSRAHFLALCAQLMRRILVDAARSRASAKRGGGVRFVNRATTVDIDQLPAAGSDQAAALCALDDALQSLAQLDPRRAQVIELRFFGGLSVDETAEVLQVSPQTVMRDWKLARAWLARELSS